MEWLSTHPMSTGRAERLNAEVAALRKQQPEPFGFDWMAVTKSLEISSDSNR